MVRRPDVERLPVDGDPPAADAEKAAEVDNRGPRPAVGIDEHVDHQPHVLAARTVGSLTEDADRLLGGDRFGHRRRRADCRRLFRRRRWLRGKFPTPAAGPLGIGHRRDRGKQRQHDRHRRDPAASTAPPAHDKLAAASCRRYIRL